MGFTATCKFNKNKLCDISALGFIVLFLLFGIMTLPQYGLSWDEGLGNLFFGERYCNYLATMDSKYLDFSNPNLEIHKRALNLFNSPLKSKPYEFPPFADTLSGLTMEIFAYRMRLLDPVDAFHLFKVLAAGAFLWVLYGFAKARLGAAAALLAILLLGSFPRFWGDMHFNPKDIPETIFFSLTLIAFYLWFEQPSWKRAIAVGILFGISLSIKVNAVFLPATLSLIFLPWLFAAGQWNGIFIWLGKYKWHLALITLTTLSVMLISWGNPAMMLKYYKSISANGLTKSYTWNWDPLIQTVATMPEVMLALLVAGFIFAFSGLRSANSPVLILLIVWTLFPILRNSLPGMKNFDGIRHFEEFLPGACLLAAYGGVRLVGHLSKIKPAMSRIWACSLFLLITANISGIYIRYWPYEYLYYNSLVGGLEGANRKYRFPEATDYWGVSYRNGIRWLNTNAEPGSAVYPPVSWWCVVIPENIWFRNGIKTIPSNSIKDSVASGRPTYVMFITRKSWYDPVAAFCEQTLSPVHEITVDGLPILKIYRLPPTVTESSE
jgi:hypothetical protein